MPLTSQVGMAPIPLTFSFIGSASAPLSAAQRLLIVIIFNGIYLILFPFTTTNFI